MTMKVGVVGIGSMGLPIANSLLTTGFDVTGHDVRPEAVELLVQRGGGMAASLEELAATAQAIITILPGPEAVRSVCDKLLENAATVELLIDMSTSDPRLDEELAARAAAEGVVYLDAPVSRAVDAAWNGELLVMVGGAAVDIDRAMPLLEAVGSDIHHCGSTGAGHKLKLLNNLKIMGEVAIIAEVIRLARRDGLELDVVEEILATSSARSFMWDYQAKRMVANEVDAKFTVAMGSKDLTLGLRWAERQGARLPVSEASLASFGHAVELGLGDLDTAALGSSEMDRYE